MKKIFLYLILAIIILTPATASLTDTDGDLYTDAFEMTKGTDPYDSSNKPMCCGGSGIYSDEDQFMDGAELAAGTDEFDENDYPNDGISGGSTDTDGDGLYDQEEYYMYGTDINKIDTDDDQINDYVEVKTNCCNNPTSDNDEDGCTNEQEFIDRTDLNNNESYGECGIMVGSAVSISQAGNWLILLIIIVACGLAYWHYRK